MILEKLNKKHENKFIHVYEATYKQDEHEKIYEMISRNNSLNVSNFGKKENADAVGIIAFRKKEELEEPYILIQKEFRMACNSWVYNFPGGLIDNGETPEQAAIRELKEETGLDLNVCLTLPPAYLAVGFSDEMIQTVIGTASGTFQTSSSIDEDIVPMWINKKEALELLKNKSNISSRTQTFLYMWAMS